MPNTPVQLIAQSSNPAALARYAEWSLSGSSAQNRITFHHDANAFLLLTVLHYPYHKAIRKEG